MNTKIIYTSHSRRMSLAVHPQDGLVVRVPKRTPQGAVEKFIHTHTGWIQKQQKKFSQFRALTVEEIDELNRLARTYLPHRTMELALVLGFTYRSVSCRHQRSRWGSCSHRNDISLNIELMRLPSALCDYIIIHELTHTIHKHHQDSFWAHLEKVLPGAGELDKQMKQWKIGYVSLGDGYED